MPVPCCALSSHPPRRTSIATAQTAVTRPTTLQHKGNLSWRRPSVRSRWPRQRRRLPLGFERGSRSRRRSTTFAEERGFLPCAPLFVTACKVSRPPRRKSRATAQTPVTRPTTRLRRLSIVRPLWARASMAAVCAPSGSGFLAPMLAADDPPPPPKEGRETPGFGVQLRLSCRCDDDDRQPEHPFKTAFG